MAERNAPQREVKALIRGGAILVCLIPMALGLSSCTPQGGAAGGSPVEADEPELRAPARLLGELAARPSVVGTFRVRNRSAVRQRITLEKTTCSCLGVTLPREKVELEAGDTFELAPSEMKEITLEVRVMPEPGEGRVAAHFITLSSQGGEGRFALSVTVPVYADFAVQPPELVQEFRNPDCSVVRRELTIQRYYRGSRLPGKRELLITGWAQPVRLLGMDTLDEAEVEPGLWKQTWKVACELRLHPLRAVSSCTLLVTGGAPAGATLVIPVVARKKFGITVLPEDLDFGTVHGEGTGVRRFVLTAVDHRPFRITSLALHSSVFVVQVDQDAAAPRHSIEVRFSPREEGYRKETIRISTDHPEDQVIEVTVSGAGD